MRNKKLLVLFLIYSFSVKAVSDQSPENSVEMFSVRDFSSQIEFAEPKMVISAKKVQNSLNKQLPKDAGSDLTSQCADLIGSAAYNAVKDDLKKTLWIELRKFFYGTGDFALTPDGQELPVVSGKMRGFLDFILAQLGTSNGVRAGVDWTLKVSGYRDQCEDLLKEFLGFSSLELWVESQAQKLALVSLQSVPGMLQKGTTLSEIANIQTYVSLQDGREEYLAGQIEKCEWDFLKGYFLYEAKNILNSVVSNSLKKHFETGKLAAKREMENKINSLICGSVPCVACQGPIGMGAAAAGMIFYSKYSKQINGAIADCVIDLFGSSIGEAAANFAAFNITKEEIDKFHPVVCEVKAKVEEDFVLVESVKETDKRSNIVSEVSYKTASKVANKTYQAVKGGTKAVGSAIKGLGRWLGF